MANAVYNTSEISQTIMTDNTTNYAPGLLSADEIKRLVDAAVAAIDAKASEESVQEVVVAEHDEEEDVKLVEEAMRIIRELIAREATDGEIDNSWELYDLVNILIQLGFVRWEELWDVERLSEASNKYKEIALASNKGDDAMTIDEEALTRISESVSAAVTTSLSPVLEAFTASATALAAAVDVLKNSADAGKAVAQEEAPVADTEPVAEAKKPCTKAGCKCSSADECTEVAAFPPAEDEKKDDEEMKDDEEEDSKAAEEAPAVTSETVEASEYHIPSSVSTGVNTTYRLMDKGRMSEAAIENYLDYVARANNIPTKAEEAAMASQRVPVGRVDAMGQTSEQDKGALISALQGLFVRS